MWKLTSDRFWDLGRVLGFKLSQQFKDNKKIYMIYLYTKRNESSKDVNSVFENLVYKLNAFKWSKHSNSNN